LLEALCARDRDTACRGSNNGGGAGSIRDCMSVDGTVRGDSSCHGGDEAHDAAGETLMVGIGVAFGRGGIEVGGGCDNSACDEGERDGCGNKGDGGDVADVDGCDGDECVGAGRDNLDGSNSIDYVSETAGDRSVEGANLIMQLKQKVMYKEISQQQSSRTTFRWSKIWSEKKL